MEYLNIISKEPITDMPAWFVGVIVGISICGAIIACILAQKYQQHGVRILLIGVALTLCFEIGALMIGTFTIQEPTGKYKYSATIDKDKITVTEYEEFIQQYKPTIKDGVYYWTGE